MKSKLYTPIVLLLLLSAISIHGQHNKFEKRILHPADIDWNIAETASNGVQTYTIMGDMKKEGYYIVMVRIPANTKLVPHYHPENRSVTVVKGKFFWTYGDLYAETLLQEMTIGSYFTEPSNQPHFAMTKDEEVILQVNGFGPTGTTIVKK